MNQTLALPAFDTQDLGLELDQLTIDALDDLSFGVIGIDRSTAVRAYNRHESGAAGISPARVLGRALFAEVAPCMNNYLVAQRFEDAWQSNSPLDVTIDYVLTLRMRPVRVALRLVVHADARLSYVLVRRVAPA